MVRGTMNCISMIEALSLRIYHLDLSPRYHLDIKKKLMHVNLFDRIQCLRKFTYPNVGIMPEFRNYGNKCQIEEKDDLLFIFCY